MRKLFCRWFGHSWRYGDWFTPTERDLCWYRHKACRVCKQSVRYHVLKQLPGRPLDVVDLSKPTLICRS